MKTFILNIGLLISASGAMAQNAPSSGRQAMQAEFQAALTDCASDPLVVSGVCAGLTKGKLIGCLKQNAAQITVAACATDIGALPNWKGHRHREEKFQDEQNNEERHEHWEHNE